jgi:long-chain acyl-CoA synthetase
VADRVRGQQEQQQPEADEHTMNASARPDSMPARTDAELISCATARTLPGLFARRLALTPRRIAYRQYEHQSWREYSWRSLAEPIVRWQQALSSEGLTAGERVAVSLPNGVDWVCFDQAALGLGLVTVPLYNTDSPGNMAHILEDSDARLLLLDSDSQWLPLSPMRERFPGLRRVVCRQVDGRSDDGLIRHVGDWLPAAAGTPATGINDPDALATLIYTSGTTGPPKGVMLSHRNILCNAEAVLRRIPALPADCFLSFLPLAHAFERTVGYYLPMMAGCSVSYARSIEQLRDDLLTVRPTVILSVPRVYDKIYLAIQAKLGDAGLKRRLFDKTVALGWHRFDASHGRAERPGIGERALWALLRPLVARPVLERLGGRLRVAVSGGAPLSPAVARFFIGLGLPLTEGYGLTEAAPVVTASEPAACIPGYVGPPLLGIETRIGAQDELLVRAPSVMQGYWRQPQATAQAIDADGWLRTGDRVEIRDGYLRIRGRLKDILVTSTGEKVPPNDMEMALTMDPLFDQAMVVGEGRPFLAALVVLSPDHWQRLTVELGLDAQDPRALTDPRAVAAAQARVDRCLVSFPGYAQIRALHLETQPWTVEDGLLTPTLKVKRPALETRFADAIEALYARHRQAAPDATPRP